MMRCAVRLGIVAVLIAIAGAAPAVGQRAPRDGQSDAVPRTTPMKVVLARLATPGCEPDCPEWIAMQGDIDEQTLPQFRRMLDAIGNRKLPIIIDSSGGVVGDSFIIGRLIRARGLDVVVGKTLFKPCTDGDANCRKIKPTTAFPAIPAAQPARCASSCAFILAAGKRRSVATRAFVGVHQIRTVRTEVLRRYRIWTRRDSGVPVVTKRELVSEKQIGERVVTTKLTDRVYGTIEKYFAEMGVGPKVSALLKATPPTEIHWLSREDLISTSMATEQLDGPAFILAAVPPSASGLALGPPPGQPPGLATPAPAAAPPPSGVAAPAEPAVAIRAPATRAPETAAPVNTDAQQQVLVVALQQRLITAGCLAGDADGVFGTRTKAALAAFATRAGIAVPDATPDQSTLEAVRARSQVACPTSAAPPSPPRPRTVAAKRKADAAGGSGSDPFATEARR